MNFLLGNHICRGYVSFREGNPDDHSCLGVSGQTPGIPIMTYHVLIHFQRSWFLQLFSAKFHFEETKRKDWCIASLCFFSIYSFLLPMIVSLQVPPSKKTTRFFSGSFQGTFVHFGGLIQFPGFVGKVSLVQLDESHKHEWLRIGYACGWCLLGCQSGGWSLPWTRTIDSGCALENWWKVDLSSAWTSPKTGGSTSNQNVG